MTVATLIRDRGFGWAFIYALMAFAWAVLLVMSAYGPSESTYERSLIASICTLSVSEIGFLSAVFMWMLMATAMMLPTALRAFSVFNDLREAGHDGSLTELVVGYLAVWLGFSFGAATLQLWFLSLGLIDNLGSSQSLWLSAALLAIAGLYQFSVLKLNCVNKCRHPLGFFMQYSQEGAFTNGLRLGIVCLGCCWALMALTLLGGMLSIGFMALGALLMTLEKLPQIGRYVSFFLGLTLLVAAIWVFMLSL